MTESQKMFLYGIGVFNKKTNESLVKKFFKYTNNENVMNQLEPIYKLLDQTSIQPILKEELAPMVTFFKEYQELKKRYDAN